MSTINFTVAQANARLPLVRPIVSDLVDAMGQMKIREREYLMAKQSPTDPSKLLSLRAELDKIAQSIDGYVHELSSLGLRAMDLERGWIAFPTKVGTKDAYFYWEPSDKKVAFWQFANKTFANRQPVSVWM